MPDHTYIRDTTCYIDVLPQHSRIAANPKKNVNLSTAMGINISFAPRDSTAIFPWHRDMFPVAVKGLKEASLQNILPILCVTHHKVS